MPLYTLRKTFSFQLTSLYLVKIDRRHYVMIGRVNKQYVRVTAKRSLYALQRMMSFQATLAEVLNVDRLHRILTCREGFRSRTILVASPGLLRLA